MPRCFLDLTDDIIQRIAHFSNKDSLIPIPSFGPHWLNFRVDIRGKSARDFLSFRLTCKRIHRLCKLENIHVNLTSRDPVEIGRWLNQAPREVQDSISRLRYGTSNGETNLTSVWTTFTTLVHSFPALRELIIDGNPFCDEHYYTSSGISILNTTQRLPRDPILSDLRSLAISLKCEICQITMTRSMLPAASSLQHLKIRMVAHEELILVGGGTGNYDPVKDLREIIDIWSKGDERRGNQLRSLYLRYSPSLSDKIKLGFIPTVKEVLRILIGLEDLQITRYDDRDTTLVPGLEIIARKRKSNLGSAWEFEVKGEASDDDNESQTLEEVLNDMCTPHSKLKHFDPIIVIQLGDHRPTIPAAVSTRTLRSYLAKRADRRFHRLLEGRAQRKKDLQGAMEALAKMLIDHLPSLEGGSFWEQGSDISPKDWARWSWRRQPNGDRPVVELDPFPWYLSREFVEARDGRRNRGSDTSDTEIDGDD